MGTPSPTLTITSPKSSTSTGGGQSVTVGFGSSAAATTDFTYDAATGGLTGVTDPFGTPTRRYNPLGQMTSTTDANNHTTTYTYNSFWEPLATTLPSGLATTNVYNASGDLTSTTVSHTGSTRQTVYYYADATHPHDLTSVKDRTYPGHYPGYDAAGDLNYVKDPASKISTAVYNADGWKTSSRRPDRQQLHPDRAHHQLRATTTAGTCCPHRPARPRHRPTYDGDRNVATRTDALTHTTTYTYNADNQLTSTLLPDAITTTGEGYDPAGYPDQHRRERATPPPTVWDPRAGDHRHRPTEPRVQHRVRPGRQARLRSPTRTATPPASATTRRAAHVGHWTRNNHTDRDQPTPPTAWSLRSPTRTPT